MDHGLEVVDVVEVTAFEVVDGRVDVPRNRDVDEEDRPPSPLRHRPLDLIRREDEAARARGGHHDIRALELALDLVEPDRTPSEPRREPLRPCERPIRDEDTLDAA